MGKIGEPKRITLEGVANVFNYRIVPPIRVMIRSGLPVYASATADLPLNGEFHDLMLHLRREDLPRFYVDCSFVEALIAKRKHQGSYNTAACDVFLKRLADEYDRSSGRGRIEQSRTHIIPS